jgi:hypothetical protein
MTEFVRQEFPQEYPHMSKKTPNWLTEGTENVSIQLSRPTEMNGIKQNRVTLRIPTVGDLRAAAKQANGNNEEQEIILFASLAECATSDIEKLSIKDYKRVQEGYFRLVTDSDGDGIEATGKATGN